MFRLTQIFVLIVAAVWIVELTRSYLQKIRSQFRPSDRADSGDVSRRLASGKKGNRK
jgi:hypothetical protein